MTDREKEPARSETVPGPTYDNPNEDQEYDPDLVEPVEETDPQGEPEQGDAGRGQQ